MATRKFYLLFPSPISLNNTLSDLLLRSPDEILVFSRIKADLHSPTLIFLSARLKHKSTEDLRLRAITEHEPVFPRGIGHSL